jgi:hypothetical protein
MAFARSSPANISKPPRTRRTNNGINPCIRKISRIGSNPHFRDTPRAAGPTPCIDWRAQSIDPRLIAAARKIESIVVARKTLESMLERHITAWHITDAIRDTTEPLSAGI